MANIPNADGSAVSLPEQYTWPERFTAQLRVQGTLVSVEAPTLTALAQVVAALRPTEPAPATANAQTPQPEKQKPAAGKPTSTSEAQSSAGSAEKQAPAKQQSAASEKPAESPSGDSDELPYEKLREAVYKLAGIDSEACKAINASFGVKTMKDLPAEKRREALAAVQKKIAELEVA